VYFGNQMLPHLCRLFSQVPSKCYTTEQYFGITVVGLPKYTCTVVKSLVRSDRFSAIKYAKNGWALWILKIFWGWYPRFPLRVGRGRHFLAYCTGSDCTLWYRKMFRAFTLHIVARNNSLSLTTVIKENAGNHIFCANGLCRMVSC
jgi:hypothetical protein